MIDFDIPTVLATIIFTDVALAVSAILITLRSPSPELRSWAVALCAHAVGILMRGNPHLLPPLLSAGVANGVIGIGYAWTYRATCQFFEVKPPLSALLVPPVIATLIYSAFSGSWQGSAFGNLVFVAQSIQIGRELIVRKPAWALGGRWVMLAGAVISVGICGTRSVAAMVHPGWIPIVLQSTPVQSITLMASLICVVLASTGFIMMTKERSDEQLRGLAMRDRLTGCWNRIRIEEVAAQEMSRLERYALPVSLMIVDIDHFKAINDRLGHLTGDEVLRDFAAAVAKSVRATDVLGRWGGEEFVAILPSTGLFEAIHLAERVRAAVAECPFPDNLHPTASIGIASLRTGETWTDWLGRADAALYRAKAEGRDLVRWETEDFPAARFDSETTVLRLVWREDIAVGIPHLDAQHRRLFDTVNTLASADAPGSGADLMRQVLAEMREHFHDEEAVLSERASPRLKRHVEEHQRLLLRAETLLERIAKDDIGKAEVFNFVIHELVARHLLIEDMASLAKAPESIPLPAVEFARLGEFS